MQFEIKNQPDFASLHVVLDAGEQVVTETGAMMGMSPGLTMETNMKGGLMAGLKRAVGGESMFMNTYTATESGQRLDLAPSTPGDMVHVRLDGNAVVVQRGSYVASTPDVTVDSKWEGGRGFFAGESLVMLNCHGTGELWLGSYGAIHCEEVDGSYVVDTGHIVAFDQSLTYRVRSSGSMKSLFFSGEGLVCEFSGTGRVWFQTRNAPALAEFLHPFRRVKPKNND
ncbi:MAG: hypothetical protein ACI8PZ_003866 [Myxococcota bacterium]|jgi:uncharacterized protein (TIGR00266 family)